jgi:hypothetical protein
LFDAKQDIFQIGFQEIICNAINQFFIKPMAQFWFQVAVWLDQPIQKIEKSQG